MLGSLWGSYGARLCRDVRSGTKRAGRARRGRDGAYNRKVYEIENNKISLDVNTRAAGPQPRRSPPARPGTLFASLSSLLNQDKTRDNDKAHKSVSDRENDSRTHNGPADIADETLQRRRSEQPNGSSFSSRLAL